MIVSMFAEVLAEFLYPAGDYRDLDFDGTCVIIAAAIFFDY